MEKETKYNLQLFANYENASKKAELEQMLKTLEGERFTLEKEIDGVTRGYGHTANHHSRAYASTSKQTALKHFIVDKIAPEVDIRPEFLIDEGSELQVLETFLEKYHLNEKHFRHQKELNVRQKHSPTIGERIAKLE